MSAPDLTLYTSMYVSVNGTVLVQETSLTIEKKSGLKPVYTVAAGLAGMSQGASECEVTVENAVPSVDFEFLPDESMLTGAVVEIGIVMAGRQTTLKGFITDATYSHSANEASKLSFKALCRFSNFE